jgi:hypothetical protein
MIEKSSNWVPKNRPAQFPRVQEPPPRCCGPSAVIYSLPFLAGPDPNEFLFRNLSDGGDKRSITTDVRGSKMPARRTRRTGTALVSAVRWIRIDHTPTHAVFPFKNFRDPE